MSSAIKSVSNSRSLRTILGCLACLAMAIPSIGYAQTGAPAAAGVVVDADGFVRMQCFEDPTT